MFHQYHASTGTPWKRGVTANKCSYAVLFSSAFWLVPPCEAASPMTSKCTILRTASAPAAPQTRRVSGDRRDIRHSLQGRLYGWC